jgi:hypothetical protein
MTDSVYQIILTTGITEEIKDSILKTFNIPPKESFFILNPDNSEPEALIIEYPDRDTQVERLKVILATFPQLHSVSFDTIDGEDSISTFMEI